MKVKLKYQLTEPFTTSLLTQRGITNVQEFLVPKPENLQSPFDLDNMQEGIDLVMKMAKRKTLLVRDSDCDGYCSATILYSYLKLHYPDWEIDTVGHLRKTHGLEGVVNQIDLSNYEFVMIPDAGGEDHEYYEQYPDTLFLVLDHHEVSRPVFPSNVVVINNQLSPNYRNKSLSGGGVTWQFCRAFDEVVGTDYASVYMDLAAVSIIGDIMDTTVPENRYIIDQGLNNINNLFLGNLIGKAQYMLSDKKLAPLGIAFYIVPNINAICRVGSEDEKERLWQAFVNPTLQVECFKRGATGTYTSVMEEAARESTNAKSRQKRIQEKMMELIEKRIIEDDLLKNKVLFVELDETFDDIPPELNGLTAAKVGDKYNRPILVGRLNSQKELRGSIRGVSTNEVPPLRDFLLESGLFTYVSGHAQAAGFSLPQRNLERFHEWANERLKDVDLNSEVWNVDFSVEATSALLETFIYDMDFLSSVWGEGMPEPLAHVTRIPIRSGNIQAMGKTRADTIKITHNGVAYMFFKRSEEEVRYLLSLAGSYIDVVGTANLNLYRGRTTPQIFVKAYEVN